MENLLWYVVGGVSVAVIVVCAICDFCGRKRGYGGGDSFKFDF